MNKILEVKNLTVMFGETYVVDNVSFDLEPGKVLALVGESGSGKTMTALAMLDLLPRSADHKKGEIWFNEQNIFDLDPECMRKIRGNKIAMMFQEPFTALNPVMRVGKQITEAIDAHQRRSHDEKEGRLNELMERVKLPRAIAMSYPHELSGGMRQRIMLAMALSCSPDILILDEPTTALDVSIQKHVLDLIKQIQETEQFAMLFITHDFSVVNMIADDVCVMKEGFVVEKGPKDEVLKTPKVQYTKHLISCIPRLGDKRGRLPG